MKLEKSFLESLYTRYNKFKYIHPDPLEFVHKYESAADREIVGLVASSLAYGRVAQILASAGCILGAMGRSPSKFLKSHSDRDMKTMLRGFKHRFTTGADMAELLSGVKRITAEYGSINELFCSEKILDQAGLIRAMSSFRKELGCSGKFLIPDPSDGSACKRMNLFLRWMVRQDEVDPGGWKGISPSVLIVPLDTHMANISRLLGLTARKNAGLLMALEVTEGFKRICDSDPVRYDFALTRFGIRADMSIADLVNT